MAEAVVEYPNATFLGTDIIPRHFEQLKNPPLQTSFQIQSVLEPWPEDLRSSFDSVHQRFYFASFKPELSEAATKNFFNLVKSGRYVQLVDGDSLGFDRDGHPAYIKLMNFIERDFGQGGMNLIPGRSFEACLKVAGAIDVKATVYELGVGAKMDTIEKQQQTTASQHWDD